MRAFCLIRRTESYKGGAFERGLASLGYEIAAKPVRHPTPDDLLIMWNRNRSNEHLAACYEARGARVIIAENGYLPMPDGSKPYALSLSHHNGAGFSPNGEIARLEFPVKPWRESGNHIVVLAQRGIGERGVAMPVGWADGVIAKLRKMTDRPIRLRRHPGPSKDDPWRDLEGAHCAVTWGSGAGLKAIAAGIPVFHAFPKWIGSAASFPLGAEIEDCFTGDREPMLARISWAQWSLAEIENGIAFARLLNGSDQRLLRAGQ